MKRHTGSALDRAPLGCISVQRTSYRGWKDCFLLANGLVEAVVVPAIARIMQFRLAGNAEGAFWENSELDGQRCGSTPVGGWRNFGGEKCWPAPQSEWQQHQGCTWPPPIGFDATPACAAACTNGIELTQPAEPAYGIQIVRRVQLLPARPTMRIVTEFRKQSGAPTRVGIWTIAQLRDPERIYALLPEKTSLPGRGLRLLPTEPAELRTEGRLLSLQRHPREQTKIGAESRTLLWTDPRTILRIDTDAAPGDYPDGGCRTEIYTNPDPLPYVELECLGPLTKMQPGDRAAHSTSYTLKSRSETAPGYEVEAPFAP